MTEPHAREQAGAQADEQVCAVPTAKSASPAPQSETAPQTETSVWHADPRTPLRQFLHTETGSAVILALATITALIWANLAAGSYQHFWAITLTASIGGRTLSMDLRTFVNSGLMAFFFLVVGLEARREWDMGELRIRSRVTLPLAAGLTGMLVSALIYLSLNASGSARHGWGAAISTDTAFALGALALAGKSLPDRVRTFLLTVLVVDDVTSLAVIAIAYSGHVDAVSLLVTAAFLAVIWLLRHRNMRSGPLYLALGVAAWTACYESGVDPVVTGLIIGLMTYARPPAREDLEQASTVFRAFREQPTARFAQETRAVVRSAIAPNERLQGMFHPVTSFLFVPLFAVANAGIPLSGSFLAHAYTSPITLGIIAGFAVGKPVGIGGASWLVAKFTGGRLRPPVGWGAVFGGGMAAGTTFTVSFLIASLAFAQDPAGLAEAKLGVLSAIVVSSALTWITFKIINLLPALPRIRALFGTQTGITDLVVSVDPGRDHIRGPKEGALVTLVEYGDFECPFCGQAEPAVRELLNEYGELRFVFRHLPLTDVHPHAQLAAEASEAAASQGKFWAMHDLLMDHQGALTFKNLLGYASDLSLDEEKFAAELAAHDQGATRVAESVSEADLDSVSGTPTFFINGRRHHGAYDLESLKEAVRAAKAIAIIAQ